MRAPQKIITQTLELARKFYAMQGYIVRPGYRFDRSKHPQERQAWQMACMAQRMLTDTDIEDVFSEIEQDETPDTSAVY